MKKVLRFVFYIVGLALLSLGVVLNTKTGLGTSAIASIPYAISVITGISFGMMTIIVFTVFVILQVILLWKEFEWLILLQIPFVMLFGQYNDFFIQKISINFSSLFMQYFILFFAIVFTALGAMLTINMRIVPIAADGLVQVISLKSKKSFGVVKNIFDVFSVLTSITVCMLFNEKNIIGVGIGTVLSALLIGRIIDIYNKLWKEKLHILVGINEGNIK